MKKLISTCFAVLLAGSLLAACGDSTSSQSPSSASQSQPGSLSAPVGSVSNPTPEASSTQPAAPAPYDVEALLATLSEAAHIGTPVSFTQMDLMGQSDIAEADIAAMAGAQSNMYQENGGIVIVVQAVPGQAETVRSGLEAFRDGILAVNANYASEFPLAYANLSEARITTHGDYAVLAASATGGAEGYAELDTALAALFV